MWILHRREQWDSHESILISEMSSVFYGVPFLSICVIENQQYLWISKTFSLTFSKIL